MAYEAHSDAAKVVTFSALKPLFLVDGSKANEVLKFYKAAFGAEELSRVHIPKRMAEQEVPLVLYTKLKLGLTVFLVSDVTGKDSYAPVEAGLTVGVFNLETEDVDTAIANAVAAGAVDEGIVDEGEVAKGEASCCGSRMGRVEDPYGNFWFIHSSIKKSVEVEVEA